MTEWVWTKAMWVLGEVLPSGTSFTEDQEELIQKVFTDIAWNSRLADVAEFRFDVESPEHLKKLADAYNIDAKEYRRRRTSFQEVLVEGKSHLARRLFARSAEKILQEIDAEYPGKIASFQPGSNPGQKADPFMLPSIQIRASIHASYFVSTQTMNFEANDLIDAEHAALSLPYCDVLFVEGPLAQRLKTKPLELDRLHGKTVISDPVAMLAWLSAF